MKQFFKKYYVVIGFVLSFILDAQYGILEKLIADTFWLNIAKGLGALLLAYFTGNKLRNNTASREANEEYNTVDILGNRPNDR